MECYCSFCQTLDQFESNYKVHCWVQKCLFLSSSLLFINEGNLGIIISLQVFFDPDSEFYMVFLEHTLSHTHTQAQCHWTTPVTQFGLSPASGPGDGSHVGSEGSGTISPRVQDPSAERSLPTAVPLLPNRQLLALKGERAGGYSHHHASRSLITGSHTAAANVTEGCRGTLFY